MAKFVEVLVNKSRIYTYGVPVALENSVQVGSAVAVPLRAKVTTGYVLKLVPRPEFPTKDVIKLHQDERVFDDALLAVAQWMSTYYRCNLATALKTILPKHK